MRFITAVSLAVVVLVSAAPPAGAQAPAGSPFVQGQLLVKFLPGADAAARADAHRQGGGTVLANIGPSGIQLVGVGPGDVQGAAARYRRNPNVQSAEPNYVRSVPEPTAHQAGTEVVPGDSGFKEQWALNNTGQLFYCLAWIDGTDLCFYVGTPGADIDAPEAWAISTGQPNVLVAVIDSGVDYTHPDIAPNWAGGWDFVDNDADPMDGHGHGTHVTGTIAGAIDNMTGNPPAPEGIAGVAPDTGILGYRVCDANGACTDGAIVAAIYQAIADGAQVINMSLGSTSYSQILDLAIQDAWAADLVIVAAAGNNGDTIPFYPANNANTVSVGAFDEDDFRASFSNYGNWVDLSAPGNVIYSAYPLVACGGLGPQPGNMGCYTWLSGTSMASPHVAGAVALLRARHPSLTNQQIVSILLNTTDHQGVSGIPLDSWTIHGGLNIHNALSYGLTNLPPVADAGADQVMSDSDADGVALVTLDGGASTDPDGTIVGYAWSEAGGPVVSFDVSPSLWLPVGTHTMMLEVTDDQGDTGTDSVSVTITPGNTTPSASDVSVSTDTDTPVTVTLQGTDVETCELGFLVVQPPSDGTLGSLQHQTCVPGSPNADTAQVLYTPGSTGTYAFTYAVNDGVSSSSVATVTVTVNAPSGPPPPPPPNTTPTASDVSVSTDTDTPVAVILQGADAETCELAFLIVQPPTDGTLGPVQPQTCAPGSPNTDTAQVLYTPGATGIYSFTYVVNDGTSDSNVATATVTVNAPPPPPPPPPPPAALTVTGLSPGVVSAGAGSTTFVVTGTGFAFGASVALVNGSGPTPRVLGVTWDSSSQLTATIDIRSGGPRRNRVWDVQVSNPDGSTATGAGLLTITP